MSHSRSSSSSTSSRPFFGSKNRAATSPPVPRAPRALVFGSPSLSLRSSTPSSTYDEYTSYSPIFFTNAKPPPPRPKLYSSSSLPSLTGRTKLQKSSSTWSNTPSQSSPSSYYSSMSSHAEETSRYADSQRGERYSIDSNAPASHQRQPSSQPSISSTPTSASSSQYPQPNHSTSSHPPQSQHAHSYSHTSERSTTSTIMEPSQSSSSAIPSTSVTPSSPMAPSQHNQRPSMSVVSGGSGSRPSLDDRRGSSQTSVTQAGGAGGFGMGGGPSGWGASSSRQNSDQGNGNVEGGGEYSGGGVPLQFDEGVLRQLCDLDCALPLLTDRIKQSLTSCRQVALFFKSRARVEEAYARSLTEMGRDLMDNYHKGDGKAGSFLKAYQDTLRIHDLVAAKRTGFATHLNEMSEELSVLAKEMEKTRKQHKDTGTRFERNLQEADLTMEKAKARFDSTAEELERILVNKEGSNLKDAGMYTSSHPNGAEGNRKKLGKAIGKGAGLFKGKNPAQIQKQEDDVRQRMSHSSDAFKRAVLDAQSVRQEYFNSQLPKILRLLKQCADEVDLGTQYHISRYAYLYETVILQEGTVLTPMEDATSLGLKAVAETIDNRTDFKLYMQNFIVARGGVPRGPRREGAYEENYASDKVQQTLYHSSSNGHDSNPPPRNENAVFGVDLTDMMLRNGQKEDFLPRILEMCTKTIEQKGLTSMGIYRLSGTTSSCQKLKAAFDRDIDSVNLDDDEWSDINVIASTLKMWFRELPDPLFTYALYSQFMDAARVDNDRLRQIRLHEQVNELPDANYAALKHFMEHLSKIRAEEKTNQMSASNLSIVFGPTLFRAPEEGDGTGMTMAELMSSQCKAVETILLKYEEIFV